jgi:Protein of unknown function (DUF3617)
MRSFAAASAAFCLFAFAEAAHADRLPFMRGLYEITFRLELPHLERWARDQTTTACIAAPRAPGDSPLPVLSGTNAFAKCSARNVRRNGPSLEYDIACAGRDAPRAKAIYTLTAGHFRGRIAMVMGAKNMTMTEVQTGRRVGSCDVARGTRGASR